MPYRIGTGCRRNPGVLLPGALLPWAALIVAAAFGLATLSAGPAMADDPAPAPATTAATVNLEPVYAPLTGPERAGKAQLVLTMQLVAGPEGDSTQIRALIPRFRDSLIRDLFGYPLSQTGEFPEGMLDSITTRVMAIAERVYGKDVVGAVLFGQILKIGC